MSYNSARKSSTIEIFLVIRFSVNFSVSSLLFSLEIFSNILRASKPYNSDCCKSLVSNLFYEILSYKILQ